MVCAATFIVLKCPCVWFKWFNFFDYAFPPLAVNEGCQPAEGEVTEAVAGVAGHGDPELELSLWWNWCWEPRSFQCTFHAQLTFKRCCQRYSAVVVLSAVKCQRCCLELSSDGVALDLIMGICILIETVLILKIIVFAPPCNWRTHGHFSVITVLFAFRFFCCLHLCSFPALIHPIYFFF